MFKLKSIASVFTAVVLAVQVFTPFTASAQFTAISVSASVRNVTASGSYGKTISANSGDRLSFQVVVAASANTFVDNVRLNISVPNNLSYAPGSATVVGNPLNGFSLSGGQASVDLTTIPAAMSKTLYFDAYAYGIGQGPVNATFQATANYAGNAADSVSITTYGNSSVLGANITNYPGVTQSVSAVNSTKNVDATTVVASRDDYITYTLTAYNTTGAPVNNFIFSADLSNVLSLADMADNGGGSLTGNTLSFPGLTLPANGSATKSFQVRVKYFLSANISYSMSLTYGNTVVVRINIAQVAGAFTAPKTGADTLGFVFAFMCTVLYALYKHRVKIQGLL